MLSFTRRIKIANLLDIELSENDNNIMFYLKNIFDNLEEENDCYFFKDKVYMSIEHKDILFCRYDSFWSVLLYTFNLDSDDISELIGYMFEKKYKIKLTVVEGL